MAYERFVIVANRESYCTGMYVAKTCYSAKAGLISFVIITLVWYSNDII